MREPPRVSRSSEAEAAAPGSRREAAAAVGLGLAIALYGNSFGVVDAVTQLSLGGTVGGGLLGVGAVAIAARRGGDWLQEIGLRREGWRASVLWGLLLGAVMGLPGVLYALRPSLAPVDVTYAPLQTSSPAVVLALVLIKIPIFTALAEELAFRGLLQARLRAAFGPVWAVILGAVMFAAWHIVVSYTTLQATSLAAVPGLAATAYLGQTAAVLAAGVLFGLLRERMGNLAGCIVAHWLVDVLLVVSLYLG